MKTNVFDSNNVATREVDLNDTLFNAKVNNSVIYESLKNMFANNRQGTASTKTRGTVHGSTKKPYKQKGTGRARAGSKKSPLWSGGGVIFGPHPRDYSYKIPAKVKKSAICAVFSKLSGEGKIKIISDQIADKISTNEVHRMMQKVSKCRKLLYIINSDSRKAYETLYKSCRNLPYCRVINSKSIALNELFYANEVLISESALNELNSRYKRNAEKL